MNLARLTGALACSVAVLMILVTGLTLYLSLRFSEAEERTRLVFQDAVTQVRALDTLEDAVLDAETGQRGYLLTGDRAYLEPYLAGRVTLEGLTGPVWQGARDAEVGPTELRRLVDMKMEELAQTIALFDAGSPRAALSVVETDRGRELMSDIRAEISLRRAEAEAQAEQSTAVLRRYADQTGLITVMLAILLGMGIVMGAVSLYLWNRHLRAVETAEEATGAVERIEVIAHELNHRMKNMFAVAQAMLRQSARGRGMDVEGFADIACSRMTAMSQAYTLTPSGSGHRIMETDDLIRQVVRAQILDHHRLTLKGTSVSISEDAITPLALILHEWTTNALKYGAWGPECGNDPKAGVTISVAADETSGFKLTWDEACNRMGQAKPKSKGYGSKLIQACAAQLGGTIKTRWHDNGVTYTLKERSPSIVEWDKPADEDESPEELVPA